MALQIDVISDVVCPWCFIGVEGVPFFVFNRRYAVPAARDPEVLVDAMLKSEREAPAANDT